MIQRLSIAVFALALVGGACGAGTHTLLVLSHNDHTAYELDPASGKVLQSFKAIDQPHEGVVSADGKTLFVAVPNGPVVSVLDGATFKEIFRIETPLFTRTPRRSANAAPDAPPQTTASPHGVAVAGRKVKALLKVGVNPFGGAVRMAAP
jgi:hypothetical protein